MSDSVRITSTGSNAAIFLDVDRGIAFGPIMKDIMEGIAFHNYLTEHFPYISISSINTYQLCIYYREFLNENPSEH